MKLLIIISLFVSLTTSTFAQYTPNCFGSRRALVHLFEWRWADIASECERFLSKKGYCGVQVSPPNENRVIINGNVRRPWWERYQPVSYKFYTRSGDEAAFIDMVTRCNNVGVRIYPDILLNHMAGEDAGEGIGTGGSRYNTKTLEFPEVPYTSDDFHQKGIDCKSGSGYIESWTDGGQVRNCRLVGLVDLNQGKSHVREKLIEWMDKMITIGVAGFRWDAAKHMWPEDLKYIVDKVSNLNTKWFPSGSRPFVFQEVIDLDTSDAVKASQYFHIARVTEFNYGRYLSEIVRGGQQLSNLHYFGDNYAYLMKGDKAFVFVDNHDNQRGHGGGGNIVTHKTPKPYKLAVTYMLAWPYGVGRVMSSYAFTNTDAGPPADANDNIMAVTINADGSCGNGWVCEHRWRAIANMVAFSNVAGNEKMANWWDNGGNQIAFSRGNRAFYAATSDGGSMMVTVQTGMKPGRYCDIISGERSEDGNSCSGKVVVVGSDGKAQINIQGNADEPIIAFHLDSMIGGSGPLPTDAPEPTPDPYKTVKPIEGYARTVIFIKKQTSVGQDMFVRGGISHDRKQECKSNPNACFVPIRYDHIQYTSSHYAGYNAWSKGDNYLDWNGAEAGQGSYMSKPANGSPLAWTTNSPTTDAGYNSLNTYGQHYWMLDVSMDCAATDNGWFELKAVVNGQWENDIRQSSCTGSAGMSAPYTTNNHIARCGYKNVFVFSENSCQIEKL